MFFLEIVRHFLKLLSNVIPARCNYKVIKKIKICEYLEVFINVLRILYGLVETISHNFELYSNDCIMTQ